VPQHSSRAGPLLGRRQAGFSGKVIVLMQTDKLL